MRDNVCQRHSCFRPYATCNLRPHWHANWPWIAPLKMSVTASIATLSVSTDSAGASSSAALEAPLNGNGNGTNPTSTAASATRSPPRRVTVYLTRHGESEYNLTGRVGGDSDLSAMGHVYARKLPETMAKVGRCVASRKNTPFLLANRVCLPCVKVLPPSVSKLQIWHSTLRRTHSTAAHFPSDYSRRTCPELDEIQAGDCDGFTYEEIEEKWPEVMADRDRDKYNFRLVFEAERELAGGRIGRQRSGNSFFVQLSRSCSPIAFHFFEIIQRYPNGESYSDITNRLQPLLEHLQDLLVRPSFVHGADSHPEEAVLIIAHQAVLRCVLAMLKKDVVDEDVPYVKVPLHTLMRLEWGADQPAIEKRWRMDIPGADTHREAQAKRKNPPPEQEIPTSPVEAMNSANLPAQQHPAFETPAATPPLAKTVSVSAVASEAPTGALLPPAQFQATVEATAEIAILAASPTSADSVEPVFALALTPPPGAMSGTEETELIPVMVRVPSKVDVTLVTESPESLRDIVDREAAQLKIPVGGRGRAPSFSYGDSH